MRVSEQGTMDLLPRHLERLSRSARELKFVCPIDLIRSAIAAAVSGQREACVARLLLHRDGRHDLQLKPLPRSNPLCLRAAAMPVDSSDPMLHHKTTARGVYERARAGLADTADAILFNELGEITETTIANIAVERGGQWITPRLSCGLLPGTMRAQLLDEGAIVEGVIRLDELKSGQVVRCFNAVRGIFDVPFER